MKKTIDFYDFKREFEDTGYIKNFTLEGLMQLFNYLESYEDETGEELELDVIAISCDFVEDKKESVLDNYNADTIEELQENTWAIELSNGNVLYEVY